MKTRISSGASSAVLPVLAGVFFCLLFVALGFWQLHRAAEKRQVGNSFDAGGEALPLSADASYRLYQRITADGRYLGQRQFLIDNVVLDGRLGYYVVTPFEYDPSGPLLMVNRGWLPIAEQANGEPPVAIGGQHQSISGRVGRLPRVAIRPGTAFAERSRWPRHALWPDLDELAAELGRPVLPFVLLADPDPAAALERRWQPQQMGPLRHIGYAVQWFAMALAILVIGALVHRRRKAAA